MGMEDAIDGIGILTAAEPEHGVETLGDAAIISLFEATPQILALRTAQGKQLLAHVFSR